MIQHTSSLGNVGKTLFFRTDEGAANGRVVSAEITNLREGLMFKEVVPEDKGDAIESYEDPGAFLFNSEHEFGMMRYEMCGVCSQENLY